MRYGIFFFLLLLSCDSALPLANSSRTATVNTQREFQDLMAKDKINKKQVNAEVLTYLLNEPDDREQNTAAVIENTSGCNLILRVVGISNGKIYNLPVYANSKNQFVLQKGSYTLRASICGANYYSQKQISAPLILKLGTRQ